MGVPLIERLSDGPAHCAAVASGPVTELFISAPCPDAAGFAAARDAAGRLLARFGAAPFRADLFAPAGSPAFESGFFSGLFGACPVNRVTAGPGSGGLLLHAVAGAPVRALSLDGRPAACAFDEGGLSWCAAAPLPPAGGGREEQAAAAFRRLAGALAQAGMAPGHIARTWFYLDDILAWYGGFNAARAAFFAEKGIAGGSAPASTGIGAPNPCGAALAASALAARRADGSPAAAAVPSPLQGPAQAYGSLFSRAVEIAAPGRRVLLVSGTASIGPDGRTARAGDRAGQAALSLEAVLALLGSRGMDAGCVTRAVVYAPDAAALRAWEGLAGRLPLPAVPVLSAVCRADLLFEIELDAVSGETR